jgi:hypothetical protein
VLAEKTSGVIPEDWAVESRCLSKRWCDRRRFAARHIEHGVPVSPAADLKRSLLAVDEQLALTANSPGGRAVRRSPRGTFPNTGAGDS